MQNAETKLFAGRAAHERKRPTNAQLAFSLFIRASIDYPASVTAQAARIALLTREQGLSPDALQHALLSDPTRLEAIVKAAEVAHKKNAEAPQSVDGELAESIIASVFAQAGYFKHYLNPEELEEILTTYNKELRNGRGKEKTGLFIEDRVDGEASLIIEKARKRSTV